MLPDRVSKPGPLTYESGALPSEIHNIFYSEVSKQTSHYRFVVVKDF